MRIDCLLLQGAVILFALLHKDSASLVGGAVTRNWLLRISSVSVKLLFHQVYPRPNHRASDDGSSFRDFCQVQAIDEFSLRSS